MTLNFNFGRLKIMIDIINSDGSILQPTILIFDNPKKRHKTVFLECPNGRLSKLWL